MELKFNPNDLSQPNGNYFALPYGVDESKLVILSAPFDATTSYHPGSAAAPDAILDASVQIDLYDIEFKNNYQKGIATLPFNDDILADSIEVRKYAEKVIAHLEIGGSLQEKSIAKYLAKVNESSEKVNSFVYNSASEELSRGRYVALVGGDHSTPLGLMKAVGKRFGEFGVLHIDAHADLREAFEGFTYSHASIMYNVLKEVKEVAQIVQVGVRDFCEAELEIINNNPRVSTFFDAQLAERKFEGETWSRICDSIVEKLPQKVYISFDIDGLDVTFCPGTGTPVPGGLSFNEAIYLINKVVRSGRELIGFDVNEVSPTEENEWDANVGARVLYKLSLALLEGK
ncbi:MAG: agmatinase family protein [Rikenellaceae bacterium]